MAVWDQLKPVLAGLRDQQPGTLLQSPMLEVDEGRQPPFTIRLAPWAAATAAELYRRFGDDVELTVGALPYPPGRQLDHLPAAAQPADLLDPQEVAAELGGPAMVSSGHTLRHGLLLRNLTGRDLQIAPESLARRQATIREQAASSRALNTVLEPRYRVLVRRAWWRPAGASAAARTSGGSARHRCSCGSFGSVRDPELISAIP